MRAHQLTSSSTRIRLPDFPRLRDSQPPTDARSFLGANKIPTAQIRVPPELKTLQANPFAWVGLVSPPPLRRVSATSSQKKPLRTGQERGDARVKQAYSLSGSILRATQFVVRFEVGPWGRKHYADKPFWRLWFRIVSPHRAALTGGNQETRLALLLRHWPGLVAACWEDPSRRGIPRLDNQQGLGAGAAFGPAQRWWQGSAKEWDLVSADEARSTLLLGEAKWSESTFTVAELSALVRQLLSRAPPVLSTKWKTVEHALIIPKATPSVPEKIDGVWIVTGKHLMGSAQLK